MYESPENQRSFGRFLDTCVCCRSSEELVAAVRTLDQARIKGLGPYSGIARLLGLALGAPGRRAAVLGRTR